MTAFLLRFGFSASILGMLAAWEQVFARRERGAGRPRRWAINLGMQAIDAGLMLLLNGAVPALLLGVSVWAERRRLGALHLLRWPYWAKFLLSFIALDLAMYLQHRALHRFGALWRLHEVHHADLDVDVTTGLRFHPGEIALSLAWKAAVICLLGAHFIAVGVFEVALNAASMFTHANIAVPAGLERCLRRLIVTPDMHRVHHSIRLEETDSNFGFGFCWWDKLFGTYRAHPHDGQLGMTLGLPGRRDPRRLGLLRLLLMPFGAR